ncbi:MAG: hypothetical protein J1G04_03500 [Clostridiales bacterium]|nr:hypothetical protein [Clostridiales bacterium]
MKRMYAAFILLSVVIVGVAVWFSPLNGNRYKYDDNEPVERLGGIAYPSGQTVRVDFDGDEAAMYDYLGDIGATVVKTVESSGRVIVYAFCPRVEHRGYYTVDGDEYNVMASCGDGKIAVGAPVLPGSY